MMETLEADQEAFSALMALRGLKSTQQGLDQPLVIMGEQSIQASWQALYKQQDDILAHRENREASLKVPEDQIKRVTTLWVENREARSFNQFTARDIRYMCGVPDIVLDPVFLDCLNQQEKLRPSALYGLLFTCHQAWDALLQLGSYGYELLNYLKQTLMGFVSAGRRRLQHWAINAEMLLDIEGPIHLATQLIDQRQSIDELVKNYQIQLNSGFVSKVRTNALLAMCQKLMADTKVQPDEQDWDYFLSDLLKPDDIPIIQQMIQFADKNPAQKEREEEGVKEKVKVWCLQHFKDPRIQRENWRNFPQAKDIMLRWLSEEDLEFFFNLIIDDDSDTAARKQFWMQYIRQVKSSRIFIACEDAELNPKAKAALKKMREEKKTMPASMFTSTRSFYAQKKTSSVFLIQIASYWIAVFSQKGNAAYVYDIDNLPENMKLVQKNLYNYRYEFKEKEFRYNPSEIPLLSEQTRYSRLPPPFRVIQNGGWEERLSFWLRQNNIIPDKAS